EDLRRWFIQQEMDLLRFRFSILPKDKVQNFLQDSHLHFEAISDEEKILREQDIIASSPSLSGVKWESESVYKIPFADALDLFKGRKVYLEDGLAYVPLKDIVAIILNEFRATLSKALALTLPTRMCMCFVLGLLFLTVAKTMLASDSQRFRLVCLQSAGIKEETCTTNFLWLLKSFCLLFSVLEHYMESFDDAKMGRRQCKSAYNIIKNKTTPESSPQPTPKSDYCNADKAEENDLKKSLMKMLEEAFEEKMKNVSKEIGENTNKKLEEINKEIEEKKSKKLEEMNNEIEEKKNKKLEEMNNEIEEKKNKRVEEMNKEIEEKRNKKLQELDKEIEEKINKKLKEMNKEIEEKTNKKLEEINKVIEEKTNKKMEDLKKVLKESQDNQQKTIKHMKETTQDIKIEIEKLKKTLSEGMLEIEKLSKRSGNTDASITNRIQEMEDRISNVEDTIEEIDSTVKENTKTKKAIKQNVQEIWDTMKRPNIRIIGIEEGEEYQLKGTENIFNKIIEENFPNLKKEPPIKIQEAYRTPNRLDPQKKSSRHIIIKTLNIQNKERILRAAKEKGQLTYKGRPIRITPDFSMETLQARRSWSDIIQTLRDHRCQPRIIYPAKLSITIDGVNKTFQDKTRFEQYLSTNPALQKALEGRFQPKEPRYTHENKGNR
ncbi:hypothetical protein STEG23_009418, partial [Scotinomys teguina]